MAKLVLKNVGLYIREIVSGTGNKSHSHLYAPTTGVVNTGVTNLTTAGIVANVNVEYSADMVETTSMGTGGTHTMIGGLKSWSVSCEAHQDYTATAGDGTKLDAFLFNNVGKPVSVWVVVDAETGLVGDVAAGSPCYYGDVVIESYSPTSGGVGELNTTSFNMQPYDNGSNTDEDAVQRRGALFRTEAGTTDLQGSVATS